jgi:hypothetical protein
MRTHSPISVVWGAGGCPVGAETHSARSKATPPYRIEVWCRKATAEAMMLQKRNGQWRATCVWH